MLTKTKPSVGRKVWYWAFREEIDPRVPVPVVLDLKQALDATVLYVHQDGRVNLDVVDHEGSSFYRANIELHDPAPLGSEEDQHGLGHAYATWMPYQVSQAKKAENA